MSKDFLIYGTAGNSILWWSGSKMGAVCHLQRLATKENPDTPKVVCWAGKLYWFECRPDEHPQRLDDAQSQRVLEHVRDGNYIKMPEYGAAKQEE